MSMQTLESDTYTWYKIVSSGFGDSAVKRSPEEAWASWNRMASSHYGGEHQIGMAHNCHSARLTKATTRRAALDADISEHSGEAGNGKWIQVDSQNSKEHHNTFVRED